MGTGILALALNRFPIHIVGLHGVAQGLWLLNIGLFVIFTGLYAARWILHFEEARRVLAHSVVSMFFGAIPMGLATIINGFLVFGIPLWGNGFRVFGIPLWGNAALQTARFLWWADVVMAIGCGVLIPFMMLLQNQTHEQNERDAVLLLYGS